MDAEDGSDSRKNASISPDSGTAGLSFWDRQRERQKNVMAQWSKADRPKGIARIVRRGSRGSSGHRGVYRRENNRWRASIGFQGKSYNLGSFATYEEAVQARLDAEKRLYDPFLAKYREENS